MLCSHLNPPKIENVQARYKDSSRKFTMPLSYDENNQNPDNKNEADDEVFNLAGISGAITNYNVKPNIKAFGNYLDSPPQSVQVSSFFVKKNKINISNTTSPQKSH